jgi:hypothetical protein
MPPAADKQRIKRFHHAPPYLFLAENGGDFKQQPLTQTGISFLI